LTHRWLAVFGFIQQIQTFYAHHHFHPGAVRALDESRAAGDSTASGKKGDFFHASAFHRSDHSGTIKEEFAAQSGNIRDLQETLCRKHRVISASSASPSWDKTSSSI
jgi:hypothetical protein